MQWICYVPLIQEGDGFMKVAYTPKGNIIGNRIAELRANAGLNQQQMAINISDRMGRPQILSVPTISAIERGRKMPTLPIVIGIASLFGVSTDYILGLTDEPNGAINAPVAPVNRGDKVERKIITDEIFPGDYRDYHKKPVYVIFPRKNYSDQWAILNDTNKTLTLADTTISYKDIPVQLYALEVYDSSTYHHREGRPISTADFANLTGRFWVELKSGDEALCNLYNGFYVYGKNRKSIVNVANGEVLPLSGFALSYNVYREPYDVYDKKSNYVPVAERQDSENSSAQ